MPNFPIIDTHLHIWDFNQLNYSAFKGHPLFGRSYQIEDYQRDCGDLDIEAMVFLECYADFSSTNGQYIEEIKFVEESSKRDPRIRGIVPMAPVEWGARVETILEEMRDNHPTVKGIRRIIEFDKDPRALALSGNFIDVVNLLAKFGYHFEINVNHTQMDIVKDFVKMVPEVRMILDHCGKPGIVELLLQQKIDYKIRTNKATGELMAINIAFKHNPSKMRVAFFPFEKNYMLRRAGRRARQCTKGSRGS